MIRLGGTIFALLLATLLSHFGWLQPLESRLMDAQFRLLRAYALKPAPDNVVVVGFNEDTTRVLREPLSLWHPHIARFVQAAASAGATVIGLDVVLPDRSFDDIVPGNDRKLLAAVLTARRSTPVVLALTVDPAGHTRPVFPPFVAAAGSDATGYALLPVDPDGMVRRFDERIQWDGSSVPTLAGQMARRLGRSVGAGVIDFAAGAQFDFLPLETVLAWLDAGDSAKLEQAFKGRAVLLGGVLKYEDRLDAPVNLLAWDAHTSNVPGVLLHAQVLRNLLGDGLVRNVAGWVPLLLSLAAALLWLWAPRPLRALAILAVVCLAGLALSTVALARGHAVPVATPLFVALLATGARQMLATAFELRERRRLRRAFGGYVSPAVMQEILAGTLKPAPGGVRQYACVLFSDIRGFTTLSEQLGAEQTIAFLNRYFERMVPIIHTHGGTVVSFMGDGIMAVFGAPKPLPNPCAAAYATALAMLELRRQLANEGVAQGQAALEIGIGLHAGEGVAGHIGAAARHEYTVIGDVTNVAARLEGVTKEVGYRLVCSRVVAEQLAGRPELVPLGAHAIKGHSPVEIFGIEPSAPANVAP